MRALRVHAWGEPPLVDEVDRPRRSVGETLVRIAAAGLSHFDLTVAGGDFGIRPELPYVPGVEGAGVVVESDRFAVGEQVAIRGGDVGTLRQGTWAEYVVVPDGALSPVPAGLDLASAAVAHDPLTTASVTLTDVARLGTWPEAGVLQAADEVVLVTGAAGGVGSIAVQLALRAGARVIALVSSAARAGSVPAGAEVVLADDTDAAAELRQSRRITLVVDTVGGPDLDERASWVCPGGRLAVVGYTAGVRATVDLPSWLFADVSILPVNMLRRAEAGARVADELTLLLAQGQLRLQHETFAFDDVAAAIAQLRQGRVRGKAVLTPSS
jgi:NADPH:quinone reductase